MHRAERPTTARDGIRSTGDNDGKPYALTFADTIAKSRRLEQVLAEPLKDKTMADIGAKKMIGEIGGLLEGVRKVVDDAKIGLTGAASELMIEVKGLKAVETLIRTETASVRQMKTDLLGNAVDGENQETDPPPSA